MPIICLSGGFMSSLNRVTLIGNLGRDAELRYTQSQQPVATFTIATSERWTDKQGQKQERTEWHRVVAWGRLAEFCSEYLRKGRQVYVEGRLQTRQWDDKDGNKRNTVEIVARSILLLGSRAGGERGPDEAPLDEMESPDEDIPF
jgi:single-strand DNA-binding protein